MTDKDLKAVERFFDPVECALDPQGSSAALRALYAAYEREKARAEAAVAKLDADERFKLRAAKVRAALRDLERGK